ncbi:MAG: AMP-binding protein [Steroidobacteraceae bacterium]
MRLLDLQQGSDTLVWHQGRAISRTAFALAAQQLAMRLPQVSHVINLCSGRLSFMLGFAAAALRGQMTLLPPNQTPAAMRKLQETYPRHHVLEDHCLEDLDLCDADTSINAQSIDIDADRIIATLFTSGSTGLPQPQSKTWRSLARTGELDAARFAGTSPLNLVATVPAQHMFGLQTTVLLPLMSRCAIHDSKPFFPADIRAALLAIPASRALIITPTHLRACVASNLDLPELQFILSATAPLSLELAQQAEHRWHAQVLEIYGSTEAGTMATRRRTAGDAWQLMPDAQLQPTDKGTLFHAPHRPEALLLSDHVELLPDRQFRLLGRAGEQLKIAGKRASLSELTHALLRIPGVTDGVIFMPDEVSRTAALVVTELKPAQILDALAESVDPVFLPRPLLIVPQLPRNAVGKLTQAALQAALAGAGHAHE